MTVKSLDILLEKFDRAAKSKNHREMDAARREIYRKLNNLVYEAPLIEMVILENYAQNKMAESVGRVRL